MSNQYQSKPALTDALAGKLKKGESSRGLKIIDDTKNYTGNETVVNINKVRKKNQHGYELIDVNNDFQDELHKPDICMSIALCLCIVIIFTSAAYGALLLFENVNDYDHTDNSTATNTSNTTIF